MNEYSKFYTMIGLGGHFGLCFCKRCGAAILIDEEDSQSIHEKWHKGHEPVVGEVMD